MRKVYSNWGLSLLLVVPLLGVAGCSRFNREWRRNDPSATPVGMEGRWIGTWQSTASGHDGQLRAILRPLDSGRVDARFRARFWGIMAYSYRLEFDTEQSAPGTWNFIGESDLGWLAGGRFTCRGTATTQHLEASYESKRDRGKFILARPDDQP